MTKKTKKLSVKPTKHPFVSFVNFYLTSEDKKAINEFVEENFSFALDWIGERIEEGYEFKFAWDFRSECYSVMMIGAYTYEVNQGRIMSSRHTDIMKCIAILRYQHEELRDSGSWERAEGHIDLNSW